MRVSRCMIGGIVSQSNKSENKVPSKFYWVPRGDKTAVLNAYYTPTRQFIPGLLPKSRLLQDLGGNLYIEKMFREMVRVGE